MEQAFPLTNKQLLLINEQMNKFICKIILKEGSKGTGFFINIPNKADNIHALITANHIINEKYIKEGNSINIKLNNGNEIRTINIQKNRKLYTNREYDITIIEIIEKIDNIFNFLELDENIFNENYSLFFPNTYIYFLFYSKDELARVSFGIIKIIEGKEIIHNCFSDFGSTGGPILSSNNSKVIGMHTHKKSNGLKSGILLDQAILEFLKN